MIRCNSAFRELVGDRKLRVSAREELPAYLQQAIEEGWIEDERGAWLLKAFRQTYSGSPTQLGDLTGYEAAVNGRAIPDLDLASVGTDRIIELAERGYTFATLALSRLKMTGNCPSIKAYILITSLDIGGEEAYVGTVTFVTDREGEPPYVASIDADPAAIMVIESNDLGT